ncbi:MAG: SDR family oxidoreductase [Planctomycetota bacterium]
MIDQYADRWALVTGASSGIGETFARVLAGRGMHLVLVARRGDRLTALAEELYREHGTQARVIAADLAADGGIASVVEGVTAAGVEVELLVNNAGFAVVGEIGSADADAIDDMLALNVRALTRLTYEFLPAMLDRGHGAVLNIASVAGIQPVAYMGSYAAGKAYVLHFSEALWAEARDRGVTVCGVCPGVTKTEFFDVAGVEGWLERNSAVQTPAQVVKESLRAMERKRPSVVCGWKNRVIAFLVRLGSRRRVVLESRRYFRPRNGHEPAGPTEAETPDPVEAA